MIQSLVLWKIPLFYYFLVIAFILPKIPVVGKFFNIINTAIHEFGHAFMALILNGKVRKIELFQDTSGTTTTQSNNRISAFFVSLAGYPFAVSVAYLAFYLLQNDCAKGFIIGLSLLFVLMLLFWIRNAYGVIWVLLFCALNIFLVYHDNPVWLNIAGLFYATMILTESVSSGFVLLYISIIMPQKAGDSANLQKMTHIPAVLWSLLFLAYTCWVVYWVFANMVLI